MRITVDYRTGFLWTMPGNGIILSSHNALASHLTTLTPREARKCCPSVCPGEKRKWSGESSTTAWTTGLNKYSLTAQVNKCRPGCLLVGWGERAERVGSLEGS